MVVLTDVLAAIARNGRVCPQPQKWYQLYKLLPNKGPKDPAVPLILGGWWHSTPAQKQKRLREHIEWAEAHGAIDVISNFLDALQESDWVHVDEAPSGHVDYGPYDE